MDPPTGGPSRGRPPPPCTSHLQAAPTLQRSAQSAMEHVRSMMQPWCGNLSNDRVQEWVAAAEGSKARYFRAVQEGTLPLNISGDDREAARMSTEYVQKRSTERLRVRLALVGDSITREIASTLQSMAPRAVVHFWTVERLGLALEILPAQLQRGTRIPCKRGAVCQFYEGAHGEKGLPGFWSSIAGHYYNAIFVGGVGLHYLLRTVPSYWPDFESKQPNEWRAAPGGHDVSLRSMWGRSPFYQHVSTVTEVVRSTSCLSRALGVPTVYVGTTVVDTLIMTLDPPKVDWGDFYDLSLADVMVAAERRVEKKHRDAGAPLFMYPSALARACPGVRCDGMHFESAFAPYECNSSLSLLRPFIADFLAAKLPSLWTSAHSNRNAALHPNEKRQRLDQMASCLPRNVSRSVRLNSKQLARPTRP